MVYNFPLNGGFSLFKASEKNLLVQWSALHSTKKKDISVCISEIFLSRMELSFLLD